MEAVAREEVCTEGGLLVPQPFRIMLITSARKIMVKD